MKAERLRIAGLLQPLLIPECKWEKIIKDFVTGLCKSSMGKNAVWVIVVHLTKSAHFIPFKVGQSTEVLAKRFTKKIGCTKFQSRLFQTVTPDSDCNIEPV